MVKLLAQGAPEIIVSAVNVPRFSHEQGIFSTKAAHASQVRSPAIRPVTPPSVPPRGFRAEEPKDVHPISGMNANLHRRRLQQHGSHGDAVTAVAGGRGAAAVATTRSAVSIPSPHAGPAAALPAGNERSLSPARDRDGGGSTSYAAAIAEADAFAQSGFSSSGAQHSLMMAAAHAHTADAPNNVSVEAGVVGHRSPGRYGSAARNMHSGDGGGGDVRQLGGRIGSAGRGGATASTAASNPTAVLARASAAAAPTNPLDMPMLWPQPPPGMATAVPQAHGPAPPPPLPPPALPPPPLLAPHNSAVASALAASAAATARANGTSNTTFGDPGASPLAPSVRSYVTYGGGRFTSRRLAAMHRVQQREAAVQKASAASAASAGGGAGGGTGDACGMVRPVGSGASPPSNSRTGSARPLGGRDPSDSAGGGGADAVLDHNGYNLNGGRKPVAPGRQPVYQLEPISADSATPAADAALSSSAVFAGGGRSSPRRGGGPKQLLVGSSLGVGVSGGQDKRQGGRQGRAGRQREVQPPRTDASLAARETAVDESWWLWQGGAGSRVSADTRLRPSSSGNSRTNAIFAGGSLRPGTAD